jgi:hypothetical protein
MGVQSRLYLPLQSVVVAPRNDGWIISTPSACFVAIPAVIIMIPPYNNYILGCCISTNSHSTIYLSNIPFLSLFPTHILWYKLYTLICLLLCLQEYRREDDIILPLLPTMAVMWCVVDCCMLIVIWVERGQGWYDAKWMVDCCVFAAFYINCA